MRNLSLGRRHLVNAYEVSAGIGVIAGNTVWSMPERLECEVLQKARYINTWMCSNRLQLNARKTEFMWCVPPRRRHQLPVDQLTILQSPRANRSVTSACTWTATCQCTNTSRSWSVCVTAFCVNFVASVVRYHIQQWRPYCQMLLIDMLLVIIITIDLRPLL